MQCARMLSDPRGDEGSTNADQIRRAVGAWVLVDVANCFSHAVRKNTGHWFNVRGATVEECQRRYGVFLLHAWCRCVAATVSVSQQLS